MVINKTKYNAMLSKEREVIIDFLNFIIKNKNEESILQKITFDSDLDSEEREALEIFIKKIFEEFSKSTVEKINFSDDINDAEQLQKYIEENSNEKPQENLKVKSKEEILY
ncbi:hypothetical protein MYMA111404_03030 [Mycoplasma marinum]|uniref:Uncharacterized protein n=2 Tax=Mycoplasma marinum TaxID=1937190 RepID=A0A4R0XIV1_9MOLU|nr:hypothetical protein C4B24_04530 [Mycoplasma marinum]